MLCVVTYLVLIFALAAQQHKHSLTMKTQYKNRELITTKAPISVIDGKFSVEINRELHLEQCFKLIFFPRCRLKSVHLLPVKSAKPRLWSTSSSVVNCEARRIENIWSGLSRSFHLLSFVY